MSLLGFIPLLSLHHPLKVELLLSVAKRLLFWVHRRVLDRGQREITVRFTVDHLHFGGIDIALLALCLLQDCCVYF